MKRPLRWVARVWQVIRELAWIVGFMVLVLPALNKSKLLGQGKPQHSLRASVRPNELVKVAPSLPWVAEYQAPLVYEEWGREIAACMHVRYPTEFVARLKWVAINSETFRTGIRPQYLLGLTDGENVTIYVAMPMQLTKTIIEHELAHLFDFYYGVDEGEDYHPPDVFENCGLHTHG